MIKEEIYKEIDERWNLFNMNDKETENAYYTVTGLEKDDMSILELKEYLLSYLLDIFIDEEDITREEAIEIEKEVIKNQWLLGKKN